MATYYDIKGQKVQYLSSDASPATQGQVWYNSSTSLPKLRTGSTAAWATVANLPYTTRDNSGFGTQTAGVIFGGSVPSALSTAVEWNGSSYSSATSVPSALSGLDSDGPQTAGLTAGGSPGPMNNTSYDYNGASWTANPTMPVG